MDRRWWEVEDELGASDELLGHEEDEGAESERMQRQGVEHGLDEASYFEDDDLEEDDWEEDDDW